MSIDHLHWLVFGMLLIAIEIFLPTFTILWFGLGAIVIGALLWLLPGVGFAWQLFGWALASSLFTFLWFRYFKRMAPDRTKAGMSREMLIGETGLVISAPTDAKRGVVRFSTPLFGADEWEFISEQPVTVGDRVAVTNVSGNTLIVNRS